VSTERLLPGPLCLQMAISTKITGLVEFGFILHQNVSSITPPSQQKMEEMDMNLGKLQDIVKDTEAWHAAIHGVAKS